MEPLNSKLQGFFFFKFFLLFFRLLPHSLDIFPATLWPEDYSSVLITVITVMHWLFFFIFKRFVFVLVFSCACVLYTGPVTKVIKRKSLRSEEGNTCFSSRRSIHHSFSSPSSTNLCIWQQWKTRCTVFVWLSLFSLRICWSDQCHRAISSYIFLHLMKAIDSLSHLVRKALRCRALLVLGCNADEATLHLNWNNPFCICWHPHQWHQCSYLCTQGSSAAF